MPAALGKKHRGGGHAGAPDQDRSGRIPGFARGSIVFQRLHSDGTALRGTTPARPRIRLSERKFYQKKSIKSSDGLDEVVDIESKMENGMAPVSRSPIIC
jgi:hypothetical protein